jgi:Cupin domain
MYVPPGGGPPPHRHDFEEMFTVLDSEVLVTFRGETLVARAGETINVQEEFFTLVGQPVATRTQAPPTLDAGARAAFIAKSRALTPEYKTERLQPPGAK